MTYSETAAIVYRITSAYPSQANRIDNSMTEGMVREWHECLKHLQSDGVMEAVTALCAENKWMPSLSEVIGKILDIQYGTEDDIIRDLDRIVMYSSSCIIFGQVTEEQIEGFNKLSAFQKLIIHSPEEFNLWMMKDKEWKAERILRVKREIQFGRHTEYLNGESQKQINRFDVFKALEERKGETDDGRENQEINF